MTARTDATDSVTAPAISSDALSRSAVPNSRERHPVPRVPAWARVLLAMVGMMTASFSGLLPMLIPGMAQLQRSGATWPAVGGLAVGAFFTLGAYLLITWALVRGIDRRPFRSVGLALTPRAALGLVIALAITVTAVIAGSAAVQALGWGRMGDPWNSGGASLLAVIVVCVLMAFVLQGIGEETVFRGYLLQSLSHRPVTAVIASALAFGALHVVSNGGQTSALERIWYLAIPTGFALLAGFLAIRMGTAWAAIGVHGGFHVATYLAAAMGITVTGPAQWIVSGAVLALIGAAIAVTTPKQRWAQVAAVGPYGR